MDDTPIVSLVAQVMVQLVVLKVIEPAGCPDAENDTGAELPVSSDAEIIVAAKLPGATTGLDEEADRAKVVGTIGDTTVRATAVEAEVPAPAALTITL